MSGLNLAKLFRYRLSSLMLLTAAIAVVLGGYRLWLQSRAPLELDRALAQCDTLRIQYPRDHSAIITWELSDRERIREIRALMAIPKARVNTSDDVIMGGGPGFTVTLLRDNEETANFYVVYYLLTTPEYPEYKSRHYLLRSDAAWNQLLRMSEQQAQPPAQ